MTLIRHFQTRFRIANPSRPVGGSKAMKPRRVALIGFDEINAIDLVGPAEAFASALVEDAGSSRPGYTITILGVNRKLFRSESGVVFKPH